MRRTPLLLAGLIFYVSAEGANINVTYNINTDAARTPISKYIYGTNWYDNVDYTIQRIGGNRCTAYNWENNWSNAGSDWYYENDQMFDSNTTPGKGYTKLIDQSNSLSQDSIVTLQLAGYVSAPIFKQIDLDTEAAPSIYFYPVVFAKGAPFCSPPDEPNTSDDVVYMDEFVNFLVYKYGYAGTSTGIKFYALDNEPECWSDGNKGATHPEVHPARPTCTEIVEKNIACTAAVKNIDPNAQILGFVSYGFGGYLDFGGAADWSSVKGSNPWFISYYLDEMRSASNSAGKRLLDVLDVHWYPEAQDGSGHRITNTVNTTAMYTARMQAPRTLWDTGYVYPNNTYPDGEVSWINQWYFAQFLPILTRLKADIQNYYPDTNLAITEYAYGGESHWSGGIATADVLGIYGKYGVYIASYWGSGSYVDAAIKMYRNYDSNNSKFGDTEVYAAMSNKVDSSIYASVFDGNTSELHLIVLNKNINNAITGTFNITSPQYFVSGRTWKFDDSSSTISETTPISSITNNTFTYTIPATTVCHIVLQSGPRPPLIITKCKVTAGKTQYHYDGDFNDMKDSFEASGTATFPEDLNDINDIIVTIASLTDDAVIYQEPIDFNASADISKGKYKYTHKNSKGSAGAITKLSIDFNRGTFALKAKNIDLTGLACPVEVNFIMGSHEPNGQAGEDVVNGSRKTIPTRLMRMYKDTLIVTKARARSSTQISSDSLSIKGDIAVADMNLDANEPNLVTEEVVITLSDANDTNTQTFTIPAGSFKASKKGHLYKCSKINPVIAPAEDVNTLITASIDLDKCTFTVSITKADISIVSNNAQFGLSFATFDETADMSF